MPFYRARERALIASAVLDLHRAWVRTYFDKKAFGSHADEFLLCMAIIVGQAEGRPMNATKLATLAGLPRPTVMRKLAAFQMRGLVRKVPPNGYAMNPDTLNSCEARRSVDASISKLARLYSQLSILDTRSVSKTPNREHV